ncbi:hypothetical protein VF08_37875, partial [Nostoc linckia z8]
LDPVLQCRRRGHVQDLRPPRQGTGAAARPDREVRGAEGEIRLIAARGQKDEGRGHGRALLR